MFQETYIFVAIVFTLESFNFNILIFDQEIGLYKPFQFLWSLRSGCFKAHFQNLKTNTLLSLSTQKLPKIFGNVENICVENICVKNILRPMSRELTTTIALDLIGLSDTKSFIYSTFSKISTN
jgi:hypothetical protein